jgi:hypothetical protein
MNDTEKDPRGRVVRRGGIDCTTAQMELGHQTES